MCAVCRRSTGLEEMRSAFQAGSGMGSRWTRMIVPSCQGQDEKPQSSELELPPQPSAHTHTPPSATTIANDLVAHPCQGPSSGMGISPGDFNGGGDSARGLANLLVFALLFLFGCSLHGYPSPIAVFQFLLRGRGNRQPLCPFCFFQKLIRIPEGCIVLLSLHNDSPHDAKSLYITDRISHL